MRQLFFFGGLILPAAILGIVLNYALGGIGVLVAAVVAAAYGWNYDRIYAAVTQKK